MNVRRMKPDDRRSAILSAAVSAATNVGYVALTGRGVATASGVSLGLVMHYFKTTEELKSAIMQYAVDNRILSIIAEGLAIRDPIALAAPTNVRAAAIETL